MTIVTMYGPPMCCSCGAGLEVDQINRVSEGLAKCHSAVAMQAEEPAGAERPRVLCARGKIHAAT